jgi:murein DD-endopeptidase MepM/ murein hydrolase activator NlpD
VHVIAPGETLMKLSRQYNKSLVEIARANNIAPYTLVKVGDRIIIPGVHGPQAAAPKPAAKVTEKSKPAQAATPAQKVASVPSTTSANVVTPAAQPAGPEKGKPDVTAAMPTFRWPVRGRVIAGFGPKPNGQQNDGINVAVPEGTPVKAAEDGVVAYAGNELKSYGNLVLVRHSNGYVTAYAHASEILVKRDDPVKRGQVIAKSGQTGSVAAPQLHFEIRKGSTPVDPVPFLDKGGHG